MINGEVKGLRELEKNLQQLGIDITGFVDGAVNDVALQVQSTAIKSIHEVSPGRTVQRKRQGGEGTYDHIASRPGDAPNTDTGRLASSIARQHIKGSGVAYVSTDVEYASELEFGTRRVEARPFLQPAVDSADIIGASTRAVNRAIEKANKLAGGK
jgi:hypothetical protein